MQNAEIKRIIEASFPPPAHCGVELLPISETLKNEIEIRFYDPDDGTLIFRGRAQLKIVQEREGLDRQIAEWRKAAVEKGVNLE